MHAALRAVAAEHGVALTEHHVAVERVKDAAKLFPRQVGHQQLR
jgi:hypothetical protein